jgi:hypothetical protein
MLVEILTAVVFVLFCCLLAANFYFRWQVVKVYRRLSSGEVGIRSEHVFDKQKLEEDILSKYPHLRDDVLTYVRNIRLSMKVNTTLIVLISLLAAAIMYYKK